MKVALLQSGSGDDGAGADIRSCRAEELGEAFDAKVLYEVTGQPEMLAIWLAAKILWLNRHDPSSAERTDRYLLIEDWLIHRLTGEFVTEGSLATSTCYWDIRTKDWRCSRCALSEGDDVLLLPEPSEAA
jgi:sugar (pentulose or hexulose) kinase